MSDTTDIVARALVAAKFLRGHGYTSDARAVEDAIARLSSSRAEVVEECMQVARLEASMWSTHKGRYATARNIEEGIRALSKGKEE